MGESTIWNFIRSITLLTFLIWGTNGNFNTPKLIIKPPLNANAEIPVAVGENTVLTCEPEVANPGLITDLKWFMPNMEEVLTADKHNYQNYPEIEISDGSAVLAFTKVRQEDSGKYTCKARYSSQELTVEAVLRPYDKINVINAPRNQYATLGQTYTVQCEVAANPSPTVSWFKDKVLLNMTLGRYAQDTKGLIIQEASKEDEGVYVCKATVKDLGQRVETIIILQVVQKPEITFITPGPVEGTEGETVVMECKTSGDLPEIEWTLRGMILSNKPRFAVDKTNGRLQIDGLKPEDTGEYQCRANNTAGEDIKITNLVVFTRPSIEDIVNQTSAIGNESVLTCRAKGHPLPEVSFQKDGNDGPFNIGMQDNLRISQDRSIDEREGVVQVQLKIRDLKRTDDGLYKCIAGNKRAKTERMGHITVQFPPHFVNNTLPDFFTFDRFPVNLTCIVDAIPNATVTWFRGGQFRTPVVEDHENRLFSFPYGSHLQVTPNRDDLYGPYICEVRNYLGHDQGFTQLKKAEPPSRLQEARLLKNTATTLTFSFAGPAYNGGVDVDNIKVYYKLENEPNYVDMKGASPHDATITIEGLEPLRTYKLKFAAHNRVGEGEGIERIASTTNLGPPEPPVFITETPNGFALSDYQDRMTIRWRTPEDNGERITRYEINYFPIRNVSNGQWQRDENVDTVVKFVDNEMLEYTLVDLLPNHFYKVEVKGQNRLGWSMAGEIIIKTTEKGLYPSRASDPIGTGNMNTFLIIGFALLILLILVFIDLACCRMKQKGLFHCLFGRLCGTKGHHEVGSSMTKGSIKSENFYEEISRREDPDEGQQVLKKETDIEIFPSGVSPHPPALQPLISDSNGNGKLYGGSQSSAHTLV